MLLTVWLSQLCTETITNPRKFNITIDPQIKQKKQSQLHITKKIERDWVIPPKPTNKSTPIIIANGNQYSMYLMANNDNGNT